MVYSRETNVIGSVRMVFSRETKLLASIYNNEVETKECMTLM